MSKKKDNKKHNIDKWSLIILIALSLSIMGLTFGFAAVSRYIVIQSNTKVKYNEYDFKVQFSSNQNGISNDIIIPSTYPHDINATNGYIDNKGDGSIVRNLSAEFTAPGQSVTYVFYAYNSGKYSAFLKSINFNKINGENTNKICTAITPSDQETVDKVCNDINISVKVGKENPAYSTVENINNHILLRNHPEQVIVTISYDDNAVIANGDFKVNFGDIVLKYSSVD